MERARSARLAYIYAPDRKAERPIAHLAGFHGVLQVDGYAGHRALAENRKNSLFAGSDCGGEHWAVLASLVETCKLNDVEPQGYLADVLTRLVNRHPNSRLDQLLPWA